MNGTETDDLERLAEGDTGAEDVPLGDGLICPECGERLRNPLMLGLHRKRVHGVQGKHHEREARRSRGTGRPPGRPRKDGSDPRPRQAGPGGSKGSELNRLRRELKKDVSALTLLPFMAKGTAERLVDPRVTQVIDEKAESFADAWVAVAEQNDWVRKNLATVLGGGVWLNAAAQTLALGYVVAVFSGVTPMHPGAIMLLPDMAQFLQQTPPAAAQSVPADANGSTQAL